MNCKPNVNTFGGFQILKSVYFVKVKSLKFIIQKIAEVLSGLKVEQYFLLPPFSRKVSFFNTLFHYLKIYLIFGVIPETQRRV